jgi:endo-1,3(4)-beta-glucanase
MFQAAEGTEWTLTYELPTVAFAPPRPIVPAKVSQLESALANDTNVVYAQIAQSIADPYDAFRRYGAMARLAEIAEELGDSASAATARQLLEPWPSRWLESASVDNLVYDKSWGGVVVQGGLTTADDYYYNGYYNDHHFQYGYMIYAAALLAKPGTGDASWLAANGHQDAVTALVRDIANPSANDPYFPPLRYWDWYWGHSWTLGILHDGNGRDEESESEATNAWYAVSLYGQAIRNVDMQNVGRLLAGMEIVSAQTYWQIPQASTVYPEAWATIGVAPNPHSLMVDFETYFGVQDEYMYGIEALPFTPISEALINPQWIADRWQSRLEPRLSNGLDENWRAYLYMLEATADPATAQSLMASAPPQMYLWGNSETNTLWFLATRPH